MKKVFFSSKLTFFIICCFSIVSQSVAADWASEKLISQKYFENFYQRSVAVDDLGNPYFVYGGDKLYFSYNFPNNIANVVDISGDTALSPSFGKGFSLPSLAISFGNNFHIAYKDNNTNTLKYATSNMALNLLWTITEIDTDISPSASSVSIVIDNSSKVHISYHAGDGKGLRYATNATGEWVTTMIDPGDNGKYTSIAVDSNNNLHISYYDYANSDLKYATNANAAGEWVKQIVDFDNAGFYSSIGVDSVENVHIAYSYNKKIDVNSSFNSLKYTTKSLSSVNWTTETIIESKIGNKMFYKDISLDIDSLNKIHISFFDDNGQGLSYITNSGTTGEWAGEVLEPGDPTGQNTSIAIDNNDNISISYFTPSVDDLQSNHVKYRSRAKNTTGWENWSVDTIIDSWGAAITMPTVVINSNNKVHLAYADSSGKILYGNNTSGKWEETLLDTNLISNFSPCSSDSSGNCPISLAIDSQGSMHISYRGATTGAEPLSTLEYINNVDDIWRSFTLVNIGGVGSQTSLAINSSDGIYILFGQFNSQYYYIQDPTNPPIGNGQLMNQTQISFISTSIDSTDTLHGLYGLSDLGGATSGFNLHYFSFNATSTPSNNVDETIDVGFPQAIHGIPSFTLTDSGEVHVVYKATYSPPQLFYHVVRSPGANGTWAQAPIIATATGNILPVGDATIVAKSGTTPPPFLHITYYDGTNINLLTKISGTTEWTDEVIGNSITPQSPQMTIDSRDYLNVGYFSDTGAVHATTRILPLIDKIYPETVSEGQTVGINGSGFIGVESVSFGDTAVAAEDFTVVSKTKISAVVRTGSSGTVSVTTIEGTASSSGFEFLAVDPLKIDRFFNTGARESDTVTIEGKDFVNVIGVRFGDGDAESFTVNADNTEIKAVVGKDATSGNITVSVMREDAAGKQQQRDVLAEGFVLLPPFEVVIGENNSKNRKATPGAKNVPMLQFIIKSIGEEIVVSELEFEGSGSGNEQTDIEAVNLYKDNNQNGIFDEGDEIAATAKKYEKDDGTVIFSDFNINISLNGSQHMLLTYDFSSTIKTASLSGFNISFSEQSAYANNSEVINSKSNLDYLLILTFLIIAITILKKNKKRYYRMMGIMFFIFSLGGCSEVADIADSVSNFVPGPGPKVFSYAVKLTRIVVAGETSPKMSYGMSLQGPVISIE